MYSDLFLQQQSNSSFPRVFIVAIVALLGVLVGQVFVWYASVPTQASNVRLVQEQPVNVSDMEAGIFFQTNESVGTSILYGETPETLNKPAYKSGDTFGNYQVSKLHLIPISGLRPDTTYYYKIFVNDRVLTSGSEEMFSFKTQSKWNLASIGRQPIYGKVITPEGVGLANVFVVVRLTGIDSQKMYLTISKDSGEWLVAMPTKLEPNDPIELNFIHEVYSLSHVKTVMAKSAPIPQSIVIGKDYTFTSEADNVLPAATRRTLDSGHTISLLYPEKNAIIPNTRPLFKGYGVPNTKVVVRVNSKPQFEGIVNINAQGTWVVEASKPFAPGPYTLAVDLIDNLGQVRTITRTFNIAKSGEQVLGESNISTPSGTLTPTRGTTPIQTPTQPIIITATPQPTGVIYITATPNPTVFDTITPTTPTQLVDAGGEIPIWWVLFGSLLLAGGVSLIRFYPNSSEH